MRSLETGSWNKVTWQIPAVPSEKTLTPKGPAEKPMGRFSRNFRRQKLGKKVAREQGKKLHTVRQCRVRSAQKRQSETRSIYEFCFVPLHKGSCFEKYHTLKHQVIFVLKMPSDILVHQLQHRDISINIPLQKFKCL